MKTVTLKRYFQILSVLAIGFMLAYKTLQREFPGIGYNFIPTIKQSNQKISVANRTGLSGAYNNITDNDGADMANFGGVPAKCSDTSTAQCPYAYTKKGTDTSIKKGTDTSTTKDPDTSTKLSGSSTTKDPSGAPSTSRGSVHTTGDKNSWDSFRFRCKNGTLPCLSSQVKRLEKMISKGFVQMSHPTTVGESDMLPLEKKFLRLKPLEDHLKAGNETTSTIEIVGKKKGYRKGDNLTVLVTIHDGYDQSVNQGGDQIRVWMTDEKREASLATEVDDLGNGSYIAVLPLAWSGEIQIKASLVYTMALQRSHYFIRYVNKTTKYIGAAFRTNSSSEVTLCSSFRETLGYSKVCNLTAENGGMPWFCGFPQSGTLNCKHWQFIYDFYFVVPLPGTAAEKHMWTVLMNMRDTKKLPTLKPDIKITVLEQNNDRKEVQKLPLCKNIPIGNSWHTKAPRGYFMNKTWIPTTCTIKFLTKKEIKKCLKNTTVIFLGDSNALMLFLKLVDMIKCVPMRPDQWHTPRLCTLSDMGTVLRWRSHAFPFYSGSKNKHGNRSNQRAVQLTIDEIPNEGRFLLIIHLFVHFTPQRDIIFKSHIRAVRISVENLLQRNPSAVVVIRGPHVFNQFFVPPNGGDLSGRFYTEYIRAEFKELEDRVLFLQPWDMSIAMENYHMHPADHGTKAMIDVIFGHVCR